MMGRAARWSAVALLAAALSACAGDDDASVPESYIRMSLDKSQPERLLRYYFGGYVTPDPADPFEAGIVHDLSDQLYVDTSALRMHQPEAARLLTDTNDSGRIEWEEFEAFIDRTYNDVRSAPDSLDMLVRQARFDAEDPDWMRVEVDGVMTTARRRVYVRESAVRSALSNYLEYETSGGGEAEEATRRGSGIRYPIGTTFIGEHHMDGKRVETTVMRKREDGFWDFFVYDQHGALAPGTSTPPRDLKSPVQCVGCHFGNKLFEPEESFPIRARPGPHGPRQVHAGEDLRDEEIVRRFDEHRRRSDTILGLYTTLFVSELRAARRDGTLSESDAALLDSLSL